MNPKFSFILAILLIICAAGRPDVSSWSEQKLKKDSNQNNKKNGGLFGGGGGGGFGIPGWGNGIIGGGYGGGMGGAPTGGGGYSKGGIIKPTVVCKEKGPCYNKNLTCPSKCFTSFSRSGKGYSGGGGGGGCNMDCKKKCIAYCYEYY